MKFDSIIFDLDGTLWNAVEEICHSWNIVLNKYENIKKEITITELKTYMGLPLYEIGEKLFPDLEESFRIQLIDECCEFQNEYLNEKGGKLYPKLEDTLEKLYKTHKLFIVSNCQHGYIQCFLNAHKLNKYFIDFEYPGATGLSKGENNKLIIKRNNLKSPVYVGDIMGDAESARIANIPFIYAKYGFGNVDKYDYVIEKFEDILSLEL